VAQLRERFDDEDDDDDDTLHTVIASHIIYKVIIYFCIITNSLT